MVCGKLCSTRAGQRNKASIRKQTNQNLLRAATIIDWQFMFPQKHEGWAHK